MNDPGRESIPAREAAWAALFFVGATLLATWPVARELRTGLADVFDGKLTAWILHWNFHQTFRDPLRLFDANIFYPDRDALAFSENLYGAAIFGFPLYAAGISTLAGYNVLFLLGMFLSGWAAWALAREVTGDPAASLLAGVVYAFAPWRISQIPHIQFQWGPFLPLVLLFFLRYVRHGGSRDRVLFAVCLAWNGLCNVHYAFFSAALVLAAAFWAGISGGPTARRRLLGLLPAAAVAGTVVGVFFIPYLRVSRLYGFARSTAEALTYSGRPGDFLSAGSRNWLYGDLTRRFAKPEGDFFPGLVPFVLAVLALRLRRPREEPATPDRDPSPGGGAPAPSRRRLLRALDLLLLLLAVLWIGATLRPGLRLGPLRLGDPSRLLVFATVLLVVRWTIAFPRRWRYARLGDLVTRGRRDPRVFLFGGIAAVGAVIALGLRTPYYRFFFDSLGPLLRGIRAPSRGIVLFDLGLGVLAAMALAWLARPRGRWRRPAVLVSTMVLVGIEYRAWPIVVFPVDAKAPPVYRWLASAPVPPGVMEWPLGFPFDFEYEFRSTAHWKPIVNGASGFAPPKYFALWMAAREKPIPDAVWDRARDVGASVLVFHPHDAPGFVLRTTHQAVRRGLEAGRLEILEAFPHGADTDYVFRVASAAPFDAGVDADRRSRARASFENVVLRPGADPSPPLLVLDGPLEGAEVAPGQYAYGWAADDSGIERVHVETERGEDVPAEYRGDRPDVAKLLWGFAGSERPGVHFAIPDLPPGEHVFVVTAEAVDGGTTVLRRRVRVR